MQISAYSHTFHCPEGVTVTEDVCIVERQEQGWRKPNVVCDIIYGRSRSRWAGVASDEEDEAKREIDFFGATESQRIQWKQRWV